MTALVARPVSQQRSANQRHALVATAHTRLMMLMFLFGAAVLVVVGRLGMLAVQASLAMLGFAVTGARVGRLVELDVEDASQLPAMCEQLLANPLVEDYEILSPGAGA